VYANPYPAYPLLSSYGGNYPAGGYFGGYPAASGQSASDPASAQTDDNDAQRPSLRSTPKGLAGLFEGDGTLDWPLSLRILPPAEETQALRQEVETFLRAALKGLGSGKAPAAALHEAQRDIARLQRLLADHADQLPVPPYTVTQARRFLRHLEVFAQGLQ
jgi:hypothetical protein